MFTDAPIQLQLPSCSFTAEQKGKGALLFGEGTKKLMTEAVLAASVESAINAKYKKDCNIHYKSRDESISP